MYTNAQVLVVVYDNLQNIINKLSNTNFNYHICYIDLQNSSIKTNYSLIAYYINNIDPLVIQDIIEDNYPMHLKYRDILTQGYLDFIVSCIIHQVCYIYTHVIVINDYESFNNYNILESESSVRIHTCNSKVIGYSGCIHAIKNILNYFFDINLLHDSNTESLNHIHLLSKNAEARNVHYIFKSTQKVLVCLYGVLARSIKYTIHGFNKNVFEPLKKHGLDYDILVVNNNVENTLVDDTLLNNDDYKLIHGITTYIELNQVKITNKHIIKDYPHPKMFMPGAPTPTALNGLRQLFIEYNVSQNLDPNKYSKCITLCGDFYFNTSIPINTLLQSKHNQVYVSSLYTVGIPDGLYFGCTHGVKMLLNHYPYLHNMRKIKKPRMKNYEAIIRLSGIYNKVNVTKIFFEFVKIRARKSLNRRDDSEVAKSALQLIKDVDSSIINN